MSSYGSYGELRSGAFVRVAVCLVMAVVVRRCVFRSVLLWQSRRGLSSCCKLSYGLLGQLWCYTTKIIIS